LNVRKVNMAPAFTISNILQWLTTQKVVQNMDCTGLWKNLPWIYLRGVAGGLILVWHCMSHLWHNIFHVIFIPFPGVIFQMVWISELCLKHAVYNIRSGQIWIIIRK
jgi:hypothetical protein